MMRMLHGFRPNQRASLCSAVMLVLLPLAVMAAPIQEDPLDRAVLEIAKDLRCTVCQNQPVAESNADLAKDMRQIIREQLVAGQSRDQIVDYFVTRYGDYVLMKPPADRAGLMLWVVPPLLLISLALLSWLFLRQRSRFTPPPPVPLLSAQDVARVRAARGQQDKTVKKAKKDNKENRP